MAETLVKYYRELYEMNVVILEMSRQERWDDFVEFASHYVIKKEDIVNHRSDILNETEKESLKVILREIIENEAEITRNLEIRLQSLKQNLSSLHRGTRASQFYTLQQTSAALH